jgi:hypothetical protein
LAFFVAFGSALAVLAAVSVDSAIMFAPLAVDTAIT